jgi:hypothetical protein
MLQWISPEVVDGYTVYPDDQRWDTYYIIPKQPAFRTGPDGLPVLSMLKYRNPIDRKNGKIGGGFLIFDVEFHVPDAERDAVKAKLQERADKRATDAGRQPQPVTIAEIPYTKGTASIQVLDSGGGLVQKIQSPGSPSLYGNMVTPITVELSPEGATLVEQALKGGVGIVQVSYDVWTPVKLPDISGYAWFNAEKYMQFTQDVTIDWSLWGDDEYRDTIKETFHSSESSGVFFNPGSTSDEKILGPIRDSLQRSLDEAVKRIVIGDIAEVPQDERKVPAGIEKLHRERTIDKTASFRRDITQGMVMDWNPQPRGTLPFGGKDANGNAIDWSRFFKEVDLNDPFFKTLAVNVRANADFKKLPIDSIEVKMEYKKGTEHVVKEYDLRTADQVEKFESYVADDSYEYTYSYQVNYIGESKRFDSTPVTTDEGNLVIDVGGTGIFTVRVAPGDINFDQVVQAQVVVSYQDDAHSVPAFEESLIMDKTNREHTVQKVVFAPVQRPFTYAVKYTMANGKEYTSRPQSHIGSTLFVNDPFSATKTISVRGFGEFTARIDTIFIDLTYTDAANDYTQTKTVALTKGTTFADWSFPVINESGGKVTYSGTIRMQNGSIEPIELQEAPTATIMVGDVPTEVIVEPALVDWTKAKLVRVSMHYTDAAAAIDEAHDIVFKKDAAAAKWAHSQHNKANRDYDVKVMYYLAAGGTREVTLKTSDEMFIVPEVPV